MLNTIAIFIVGLATSFIGSIAGGAGLISIPILIFMGLPPQVAIASNRFGAVGLMGSVVIRFFRTKYVLWKYVLPFSAMGVIGGYIGSNILLQIDQVILYRIIAFILLGSIILMLIKQKIGTEEQKISTLQKILGGIIYFIIFVFGGFFGGGAVTVIFYILTAFFGFTLLEANATNSIPWLFLSLTSLIVFIINGVVDYASAIPLFIGMCLGGYLGANTAIEKGDEWVKGVLVAVSLVFAVKLLFF